MNDTNTGEFILYVAENGDLKIDVRLLEETVWLTQGQMATLFQTTTRNIGIHIQNVYEEAELEQNSTRKDFFLVQQEGNREVTRSVQHYNLDVIISVGYRVKSQRGTQFRIWATKVLREYIVKGFAMDDARLKNGGNNGYFDEIMYKKAS